MIPVREGKRPHWVRAGEGKGVLRKALGKTGMRSGP